MSEEMKTKIEIELTKEMIFKCNMGEMAVKDCFIDEKHKLEQDMIGPNPTRLLGMAVLGCLSASFIFCLKKKNFDINDLTATAEVTLGRNPKGLLRVKKIDVQINSKLDSPEMQKRATTCKKIFEDFCTVTQSVREGIDIDVNLILD